MAALLHRSELVFEVHAGGARVDHRLHQFEGVQHAAETGFGIGDDRREVIDIALVARFDALRVLDLVSAIEDVLMRSTTFGTESTGYSDWSGYIDVAVVVGGDLPARQVDGLDAGLDLLHRLAARQRAEAVDVRLGVDELPELLGAEARERVLDLHAAAQADDVFGRVGRRMPAQRGSFAQESLSC